MRLLISATAHGRLHSDVQADQTLPSSAEPGVAKQLGLKIYGQAQRCPFVLSSPSSTLFVPRFEERPASHRDGDAKVKLARRLARRELRKLAVHLGQLQLHLGQLLAQHLGLCSRIDRLVRRRNQRRARDDVVGAGSVDALLLDRVWWWREEEARGARRHAQVPARAAAFALLLRGPDHWREARRRRLELAERLVQPRSRL
mmetsp:Transcript_44652/g.93182  ORF Transcript_44652/g.93182 Transcript_44652/m.93182 type:complete len:201 (-) Transcript_44652:217-819(-)